MQGIKSKDYHDYVIKNGKLIGEFEQMYKNSEIVPWHQDKTSYEIHSNLLIEILKTEKKYDLILDVGCGLAYFTDRLKQFGRVFGIDISENAITKAKKMFEDIHFERVDIRKKEVEFIDRHLESFNLIIVKEVIWYVIPELEQFLHNINKLIRKNGFLAISLFFPPLEEDYYGKEIIPNPERLKSIFTITDKYKPIYHSVLNRHEFINEGPLVTIFYKKGE